MKSPRKCGVYDGTIILMLKKLARWLPRIGAFFILLAIGLWLTSPLLVRGKVIEKAWALGLEVEVDSIERQPSGFLLQKVNISSKELPIRANFASIYVTIDGNLLRPKVTGISIDGGKVSVIAPVSEFKAKLKEWQIKRHRADEKQETHTSIMGKSIQFNWASPCGRADSSVDGIQFDNLDGWRFVAKKANAECFGWDGNAEDIKATKKHFEFGTLEMKKEAGFEAVHAEKTDTGGSGLDLDIPIVDVNKLSVSSSDYEIHADKAHVEASTEMGLVASLKADSVEAELPKIHKMTLGQSSAQLQITKQEQAYKFGLSAISDRAQGKYRAVTGRKVGFGPLELKVEGEATLPHVEVTSGSLKVKDTQFVFSGFWNPSSFDARVSIPSTSCQSLIESVPDGMNSAIDGLEMTGKADLDLHISRPSAADAEPMVKLVYHNKCRVAEAPETISRKTLRSKFTRMIPGPLGEPIEVTTGPDDKNWVPYTELSPYLIDAIQVTEDPGFMVHNGFDPASIENSIRSDIQLGAFVRGASTVTMQLAKNLWLTREKTIARKIQEAFLTTYLEQTLSKSEILETYFNIVEFGPMVYGIHDAADHYFKCKPKDLTLSQSLFLTSILPEPRKNWFGPDGKLQTNKEKWIRVLMIALERKQLINPSQLATGLEEVPVFGQPSPEREVQN